MRSSKPSAGETIVELNPSVIYFTFSRIRPFFSCGRPIEATLAQFLHAELTPNDLPLLSVLMDSEGNYYSLNNRRLYLYKELHRRGVLHCVPVRLRQLPHTRRMREKYTPAKCALRATLKREGNETSHEVRHHTDEEEEEEEVEANGEEDVPPSKETKRERRNGSQTEESISGVEGGGGMGKRKRRKAKGDGALQEMDSKGGTSGTEGKQRTSLEEELHAMGLRVD